MTMKKIYLLAVLLLSASLNLFAQVNTLTEGFNAATPVGWVTTNNSNPNVPTTVWTSGSASTSLPGFTGAGYAVVNYQSTTGAGDISNWYISPQVNLKDGAILTFYTRTAAATTVYPDRMEVRLSTAGASTNVGTLATDVGDFTILACSVNPALSNSSTSTGGCGNPYPQTWTQYTITISGVGATPVAGRIAFRYWVTNGGPSGANSNIIGIDELAYDATTCTTPTAGTASGPAAACANTNFNLSLAGFAPAAAVIKWQSSPAGANTWTDIPGATAATASTSQSASRDYRASVTCPGGGTPEYSNTVTVAMSTTNCPPACTNNVAPANNATGVVYQPNIPLSWTAASGATSYDVYFGTSTTPPLLGNTTSTSVNITGGVANTLYYWYVTPKNANGALNNCSSSMTSFTTGGPLPAPANDECAGAITLTPYMGGAYNGTTISGTASAGIATCPDPGTPDEDVWFKFTPVQNGNATITVVGGSTFDAVLQAFTGTCGALTQFSTCVDATASAGTETMNLTGLVLGTTYYLRVYDYSAGAGDNFTIAVSGTALPVTVSSFTGRTEGSVNILQWSTATETNNKGFELQRSADGRNFTSFATIATKAENGNSASALNYQYSDVRPLSGTNYYRLKQIDKDGKFNYSDIVTLKSKATDIRISSVYPNPSRNELNLVIASPTLEKATIVVTDLTGKVILQRATQLVAGDTQELLNVQSLSAGTYMVKIICANGCETAVQRFVKY